MRYYSGRGSSKESKKKKVFIPSTSESRAKQSAILKEGIAQATGKSNPPRTTFYSSGGGGGSSPSRDTLLREAQSKLKALESQRQAEIAKEEKRVAEEKIEKKRIADNLQRQKLLAEQNRINQLRQRLQRENARRTVKTFIDRDTRDKIKFENFINRRGERIFIKTNLRTGKTTTRTFERNGGGVRETGGLVGTKTTQKQANEIQKGLPPKDRLIYDSKTMTIIGIKSGTLGKSFPWNDKFLKEYSKKISKLGVIATIPGMSVKATKVPGIDAISKKLEGVIFKKFPYTELAYRTIQNNLFKQIDKFESTQFGADFRHTANKGKDFIETLGTGIFVSLVPAIATATIKTGKGLVGVGKTIGDAGLKAGKNPKKTYTDSKRFMKNFIKTNISKVKTPKEFLSKFYSLYTKKLVMEKQMNNMQRNFLMKSANKIIKSPGKISVIMQKLQRMTLKDYIKQTVEKTKKVGVLSKSSLKKLGYFTEATLSSFLVRLHRVKDVPAGFAHLISNPEEIKKIPKAMAEDIGETFTLLKLKPSEGIAKIGADYVTFKLIGASLKITGRISNRVAIKLNPFLKKFKNGAMVIRKSPSEIFAVRGKTRLLKSRVKPFSIKRPFTSVVDFLKGRKPGQFRKFTKDPGLALKEQTVKSGASPLSAQAKLAGQEITAVNAAADQLTTWLKRKKLIRKPIPGEAEFPKAIKKALDKFDRGTQLSNKEFAKVNLWLQKNVAPNITLLERSLYLDPASGLRLSRLGIQAEKTASLMDIVRGNFKFKGGKPQVLVFEKVRVAKFPKSLTKVKNKLLRDIKLTVKETNQLIRWQVKKGYGELKPIGSTIYALGKELEVTMAPGEFIKRLKKVGTFYERGKRVTIVTAEIYKPSASIMKLLKLASLGKLAKAKLIKLEKFLSKNLGRKIKVETPFSKKALLKQARKAARRIDTNIPVLRFNPRGIIFVSPRLKKRFSKKTIRKVYRINSERLSKRKKIQAKRKKDRRTPKPSKKKFKKSGSGRVKPKKKRTKRKGSKRTPLSKRTKLRKRPLRKTLKKRVPKRKRIKRPTPRVPTPKTTKRPTKRPPAKRSRVVKHVKKPSIRIALPKGFKRITLRNPQSVYFVKMKKRGKIVNLSPRRMRLKEAKDFLAYRIDNGLSRSAWFEPMGRSKIVIDLPSYMNGYFKKTSRKLRPYKIKTGKKKEIRQGYIEKKKYFSDSLRERKQLSLLQRKRLAKKKRKIVKRKPIKRVVRKRTKPVIRKRKKTKRRK